MPIYIRVGDGGEVHVGEVEADSSADMTAGVAEFFRAVADAIERAQETG
jgi:hypothetical protein